MKSSGTSFNFVCLSVDEVHLHLNILKVADAIGLDDSFVEDQVVSDEHFDLMDAFLAPNGSKKLLFYYQVFNFASLRGIFERTQWQDLTNSPFYNLMYKC